MKRKIILTVVTFATMIVVFSGCQMDPQASREKMAFNNFFRDLKASNMIDGQIGNVKYLGNAIEFDFTDASLDHEQLEKLMGQTLTMYANNNNGVQTGVTTLKAWGKISGKRVLRAVYNAGPSNSGNQNIKFIWLDGSGE